MAIRKIDTTITPFTVTPQINTSTFPEDIDVYNTELPSRIASQNAMGIEMNEMATDMDSVAFNVDTSANMAISAKEEAVNAKNEAVNAKNVILGYVIPTNATYNPETIENKVRMSQILTLTNSI
jgi:translation elongation factor EF-1beta